jgi:hypothetical protein
MRRSPGSTGRLTAVMLLGVLSFVTVAVPLLDCGMAATAVWQEQGARHGDHRDHDHRICAQYFANAPTPTDRPILHLPFTEIILPRCDYRQIRYTALQPTPQARSPPQG